MSWCVSPWAYPVWYSLCLLNLTGYFRFHVGEIINYNPFKNFLIHFLFLFFFWDSYNLNVGAFYMIPKVSETVLSSLSEILPPLFPHGQSQDDLGMCLQGSGSAERHTTLTPEVRSSGHTWRSHVLEANQVLLDRGLQTHCLLMPFCPRRNAVFLAFCVLRATRYLKMLAWSSFFSHNVPWGCDHREAPTRTVGEPAFRHLFSHFFSVGEIQGSQGLSGKCLDPVGRHPEWDRAYCSLLAKFAFLSPWALKWCRLTSACKSVQLLYSYFLHN